LRRGAAALFLGLLVVLRAARGAAEEAKPPRNEAERRDALMERLREGPFRVRSDFLEVDEAEGRLVLAGNVEVEIGKEPERLLLFAGAAVLWGELRGRRIEELREVYAEDRVLFVFGDQSFEADALYLDVRAGEGRLANATVRSAGRESLGRLFGVDALVREGEPLARSPFFARARLARVSQGFSLFEGEEIEVSTCTFGKPHFDLFSAGGRIWLKRRPIEEERGAPPEGDEEESGAIAELESPRLEVNGLPVFLWPFDATWDTAWNAYIPRLRLGHSNRFGYFALAEVPLCIERGLRVVGRFDGMSERGPGAGANIEWRGPPGDKTTYRGLFDGYYVHDEGRDRDGSDPQDDRGRLRFFHRDELPFGLRREAEISWISDRNFLNEYFEREAKTGKEQETAGYIRWLDGNMGAALFGRVRLNDFQTQTEYLPRARWSWIGEPLFAGIAPGGRGLYLTTAYELSNVRRRFDEAIPNAKDTDYLQRADFENRLDYPRPLGPLVLDLFATARYSVFSKTIESATERARTTFGAGATAATDVSRDFDFAWDVLGIDGLRHIVTPSSGYLRVFYNDLGPESLVPLDEIEEVRESEFVPISLRNRLTAFRPKGPAFDFLDLLIETRYFPRSRLALSREPFLLERNDRRRSWDLIHGDLRLTPHELFALRAKVDFDPEGNGAVREDAQALVRVSKDFALTAGYRALEGVYEAVEAGARLRATEKWALRASSQYDFERQKFVSNHLSLVRFFHRFFLDVRVDADFGEKDVRFSVNFAPVEMFDRDERFHGEIDRAVDPFFGPFIGNTP
jgi:hypothetical protein